MSDTVYATRPDPPNLDNDNVTIYRPDGSPDYIPGGGNNSGGNRTNRPPSEPKVSEQRLTTAAEGELVPHIYGRAQIGGSVFAVGFDDSYWYIGVVWCLGGTRGIKAIEKVFNGEVEVSAENLQHFLGKPYQDTFYNRVGGAENFGTTDATRNWLYQHIEGYSDTMVTELLNSLVGLAYSIVRIPFTDDVGQLVGQINGFMVKDYSSTNVPDTSQLVAEPIELENNWVNYASWFGDAKYFAPGDGSVFIQGLVKNGANGSCPVGFLPKSLQPKYHHVGSTFTNNETARVDIRNDGSIVSPWGDVNGGFNTTWASITTDFCADETGWVPLVLLNGWANYAASAGYAPLSYKVMEDGRVYIRGLVIPGTIGQPIAQLPSSIAPPAGLIFSCRTQGDTDCRVDIAGTAIISRNGANWVSVFTSYYPDDDGWTDLPLLDNWQNYGGGWQTAQYKKMPSGIVAVRGLVQNLVTTSETNIGTLPAGCRPKGALVACSIQGDNLGNRLDYREIDGIIIAPNGIRNSSYLSINRIFIASDQQWTYVESTNPSNALADHIESKAYGLGANIGSASMTSECVDYNNEFVIVDDSIPAGTEPNNTLRHEIGYVMSRPDSTLKYVDVLRDYANCFAQYFGLDVFMVPDRKIAGSGPSGALAIPDFYAQFDDSNIISGTLKIKKSGDANHPTVVRVNYTDRTPVADESGGISLWGDGSVVKYFNDDISQVGHWKEANLSYPGIPSKSQATRKAIEYLNHLWLEDLEVQFDTFGEAMTLYNGSPFLLKHYIGIGTNLAGLDEYKPFRCTKVVNVGPNRYRVYGREYQDDAYSNVIDITPGIPDTNLPNSTFPVKILSLTITERSLYDGSRYYTVFDVIIGIDEGFPYKDRQAYNWKLIERGASVVEQGEVVKEKTFTTGRLSPDTVYSVEVTATNIRSSKTGPVFSASAYATGKDAPPSAPGNLKAEEYGETIFLTWDDADDEFPVRKYEVRKFYNPVSVFPPDNETKNDQWRIAELENKVGASGYVKTGALRGLYRFFVKAIDVFGTYSDETAVVEVVSSSDNNSFVKDHWPLKKTSSSEVYYYKPKRTSSYEVAYTCATTSFASLFTNTVGSYTYELYRYYPSGYSWPPIFQRMGDPERDSADYWPIELAAELTGKFETKIEDYVAEDYIIDTDPPTANTASYFQTRLRRKNETIAEEHIFNELNLPFKGTAKYVRTYTIGPSWKFRVDTAYIKASFITRKEHGVVTVAASSHDISNVIELEDTYYKAYKLTTQVFAGNENITHGGDNVSLMAEPFKVEAKTDISTNNGAATINSTSTDFVAAGFTAVNSGNPDVINYIRIDSSGLGGADGLYKLVSVSTNQLVVSPAPPTASAGAATDIKMVNTITLFCRNFLTGDPLAREVHWFFEGV